MAEDVGVVITADASQVKKEIDQSIAALAAFGRSANVFNQTAVRAFRDSAEAEKDLNTSLNASVEQMQRLQNVVDTFERRVDQSSIRVAGATERMGRGFSMLARTGADSARSMNTIIAAAADLAYSFGPEGPLLAGILMVAAGIIGHFEKIETKMEETKEKFLHHLDDMLASGSPVEAAREASRAYVDELEAGAALIAAKQREVQLRSYGLAGTPEGDYLAEAISGVNGAEDKARAAHDRVTASLLAQQAEATYQVHDKELDRIEQFRNAAHADIERATEQLESLKGKGKDEELKAAGIALANAETRLKHWEDRTRALEADRDRLAHREAAILGGVPGKVLLEGAGVRKPADFALEHEAEADQLARGRDTASMSLARFSDEEFKSFITKSMEEGVRIGNAVTREIVASITRNDRAEIATGDLATQLRDRLHIAQQTDDVFSRRIEEAQKEKDIENERIDRESAGLYDNAQRLMYREAEYAVVQETYNLTVKQVEIDRKRALDNAIRGVRGSTDPFERQRDSEQAVHDRADKARGPAKGDKVALADIAKREAEGVRDAWFKMVDDVTSKGADGFDKLAEAMQRAGIAGAGAAKFAGDAIRRFRIAAIGAEAAINARAEYAAVFKSIAERDPFGATMHGIAAAGYAATAVAAGVAAVSGGGGGGGGGSGGSSSRSGLGASFGAGSNNTSQMIKIEIVNVTKDQSGRETARTRQSIQRLQDLNYPIRVGGLG